MVIVDLAAGVEFMGRARREGIDMLVLIVEPGQRSIETANTMGQMAKELGIKRLGGIANKIISSSQINVIRAKMKNIILLKTLITVLLYRKMICCEVGFLMLISCF
jgi:CO dehydrogenase maturation factor